MEQISYPDFAKLDIRVGTITQVEIIEEADRLLKLLVDFSEQDEEGNPKLRQIVSGIREYVSDPQVLVGKQCPFLINLEPRTIKGYESQGMILAAGGTDVFALFHPHNPLPSGTKVS